MIIPALIEGGGIEDLAESLAALPLFPEPVREMSFSRLVGPHGRNSCGKAFIMVHLVVDFDG